MKAKNRNIKKGMPKALRKVRLKYFTKYMDKMDAKGIKTIYLYLARYENNKKKVFFKIGISICPKSRIKRDFHKSKLISKIELDIIEAWKMESYILNSIYDTGHQYCPTKNFDGQSECFSSDGYHSIKPLLVKLGMKLPINKRTPKEYTPEMIWEMSFKGELLAACRRYKKKYPHIKQINLEYTSDDNNSFNITKS